MATPPIFVKAAREIWNCEWNILMNGLAPSHSKGNYKRPQNVQPEIQTPTKDDLENRDVDQMPYLIVGQSCFNENCDPHLFKQGKPAFTAQTIGRNFKFEFIAQSKKVLIHNRNL